MYGQINHVDKLSIVLKKRIGLLRSVSNKVLKVPEKPKVEMFRFYLQCNGAKLFNMLLLQIRETKNPNTFKTMTKDWIWKNIPSY